MATLTTDSSGVPRPKTLLLFGKTGSGKSATGNTILGDKKFEVSSMGQTTKGFHVESCEKAGLTLKIIDTPDITEPMQDNPTFHPMTEVSWWITEAKGDIDALLYVHRFGVRFTDQQKNVFNTLQDNFDKEIYKHMIVVLTYEDEFERVRAEEGITKEGYLSDKWNGLPKLVGRAGNRVVWFNNRAEDEGENTRQVGELIRSLKNVMDKNNGQPYRSKHFPSEDLTPLGSCPSDKEIQEVVRRSMWDDKEKFRFCPLL